MRLLFSTFICIIAVILVGCRRDPGISDVKESDVELTSSCPHCKIFLQPYDDFTEIEVKKLLPVLRKNFDHFLYGGWEFEILPHKKLPSAAYLKERNRYKALLILKDLKTLSPKKNETIIGLSHQDICADVHGDKDWGIIGLSFCPGQVSIVSDYRLKNNTVFWKPIIHEFMHAFYGAKHCPKDDPQCIMADAKNRGSFKKQIKLCDMCKTAMTCP